MGLCVVVVVQVLALLVMFFTLPSDIFTEIRTIAALHAAVAPWAPSQNPPR